MLAGGIADGSVTPDANTLSNASSTAQQVTVSLVCTDHDSDGYLSVFA